MKLSATIRLWAIGFLLTAVIYNPAPINAGTVWPYVYADDFDGTTAAETDSLYHTIFWPEGAYPPTEAFLYYSGSGQIGFAGYGDTNAVLAYRFPTGTQEQPEKIISGNLQLDVQYTSGPDPNLLYSLSSDGVIWSNLRKITAGVDQNIPLESITGYCYIKFEGKNVLLDNLEVTLSPKPTILIPSGTITTIQQAIEKAKNGYIIEVKPGTYSGNIDFKGKAITLRSQAGPNTTIIDCNNNSRGFIFQNHEEPNSVLCGFTIINASAQSLKGGGIYCNNSSPSIVNCIIKQCTAQTGGGIAAENSSRPVIVDCNIEQCTATAGNNGGGIYLIDSNALIINSIIKGNSTNNGNGAGIYSLQSAPYIVNCNISRNTASGNSVGGGIYCGYFSGTASITNCIISGNTAYYGSGIEADNILNMLVTNCTIADNKLSQQTQISYAGGLDSTGSNIFVENSIIWYNDNLEICTSSLLYITNSDIEGSEPNQVLGNINENPLFVSRDPNNYDYHLKSLRGSYNSYDPNHRWVTYNEHSPCIDAGDDSDPVGAEPCSINNHINMGAYGGTVQASKSARGFIFHVDDTSGDDFNCGLGRTKAFKTIQRAVNEALNGDFVMVWPGTYQEQITFMGKAITMQSADDAAVVKAPGGYGFSFNAAESSDSILRNMIISDCIRGVDCEMGASPTLTNLTIVNNVCGIYSESNYGFYPYITNCILCYNTLDLFGDNPFHPDIHFSCIQQDLGTEYFTQKKGNIMVNPSFANPDSGDYHLKSQTGRWNSNTKTWEQDDTGIYSPCIDAGDPLYPVGAEPSPNKNRINMGAHGGTAYASKSKS